MKKLFKQFSTILCVFFLIFSTTITSFAHSGRTDSSGGHKDNRNASGLGSYHYHCGGYPAHLHTSGYCPYRDVFPTSVKLSAKEATLFVGEKITVTATVSPSNACNTKASWKTSDANVASVKNGVITAKAPGTAIITAYTFNEKTATFTLTVAEKFVEFVDIAESDTDILIGEELTLSATVAPADATYPKLTWTSSNPEVATVSKDGVITTLTCGETVISATSTNGISDSIALKVHEIKAESIAIEGPASLLIGDKASLTATITPANVTDTNITWSIDNADIAKISENGELTALGVGMVTVTVTQKDVSTSHKIEVLPINVTEIKITASADNTMAHGNRISYYAKVLPENATYPKITWSVSVPEVASIDKDGNLTPIKAGKINVIATAGDGFTAEYEVTILPSAASMGGAAGLAGIGTVFAVTRKKKKKKR